MKKIYFLLIALMISITAALNVTASTKVDDCSAMCKNGGDDFCCRFGDVTYYHTKKPIQN